MRENKKRPRRLDRLECFVCLGMRGWEYVRKRMADKEGK